MKVIANAHWQWQPSTETLDALAEVLTSHWTAAKSQHVQAFWPNSATWLRRQATRLMGETPAAAQDAVRLITT
jgi:hypothetical protein